MKIYTKKLEKTFKKVIKLSRKRKELEREHEPNFKKILKDCTVNVDVYA